MAAFAKLTPRLIQEGDEPHLWVNLDLAVSMKRSGDRTLIDFAAPEVRYGGTGSASALRRIEVTETPEEILDKLDVVPA